MRSNIFLAFALAVMGVAMFTACEKEEEIAQDISGAWESTDLLFSRTYKGQNMTTRKTVFVFNNDREHATSGYGYAIEYYDNQELPVAYFHTRWETWTRTSTSEVGIEVKYDETNDIFKTQEPDYDLNDREFYGQCTINDVPGTRSFRFVRGTTPDVSNVKHWGYNELIPTWQQTTFEGQLDIRRKYQGTTYTPTSVIITFDVDPAYNTSGPWNDKAYVMEKYENAPWGTYLADSIKSWQINDWIGGGKELNLYFANNHTSSSDYRIWNLQFNGDTMTGDIFVETNVFTPFTMRRTNTPDWSSITQWGITNRTE